MTDLAARSSRAGRGGAAALARSSWLTATPGGARAHGRASLEPTPTRPAAIGSPRSYARLPAPDSTPNNATTSSSAPALYGPRGGRNGIALAQDLDNLFRRTLCLTVAAQFRVAPRFRASRRGCDRGPALGRRRLLATDLETVAARACSCACAALEGTGVGFLTSGRGGEKCARTSSGSRRASCV